MCYQRCYNIEFYCDNNYITLEILHIDSIPLTHLEDMREEVYEFFCYVNRNYPCNVFDLFMFVVACFKIDPLQMFVLGWHIFVGFR